MHHPFPHLVGSIKCSLWGIEAPSGTGHTDTVCCVQATQALAALPWGAVVTRLSPPLIVSVPASCVSSHPPPLPQTTGSALMMASVCATAPSCTMHPPLPPPPHTHHHYHHQHIFLSLPPPFHTQQYTHPSPSSLPGAAYNNAPITASMCTTAPSTRVVQEFLHHALHPPPLPSTTTTTTTTTTTSSWLPPPPQTPHTHTLTLPSTLPDYWQRTHYGFCVHDGTFLYLALHPTPQPSPSSHSVAPDPTHPRGLAAHLLWLPCAQRPLPAPCTAAPHPTITTSADTNILCVHPTQTHSRRLAAHPLRLSFSQQSLPATCIAIHPSTITTTNTITPPPPQTHSRLAAHPLRFPCARSLSTPARHQEDLCWPPLSPPHSVSPPPPTHPHPPTHSPNPSPPPRLLAAHPLRLPCAQRPLPAPTRHKGRLCASHHSYHTPTAALRPSRCVAGHVN